MGHPNVIPYFNWAILWASIMRNSIRSINLANTGFKARNIKDCPNKATLFAQCRGCSAVVLEGDSQVLVNALAGSSPSPSAVASVIQGALELCMGFSQIQFSHVKRQGNMPAHLVAKNAYSIVDDIVWVEEDPCFAKQALIHDVNFMVPLL